VQDMCWVLCL